MKNLEERPNPGAVPDAEAKRCFQTSRFQAKCDTCGQTPALLHIPLKKPGRYCEKCCTVCSEGTGKRMENEPWLRGRS